jgi:hypothetical protein
VLGPIGAGRLADVTGSYAEAMLVFAVLLAAATLAAIAALRTPAAPPGATGESRDNRPAPSYSGIALGEDELQPAE